MDETYTLQVIARFGPRLRELRTKAKLTQTALAKLCNMRQASITEYESGVSKPTWGNVVRLAHALGVTPNAFTTEPAEPDE